MAPAYLQLDSTDPDRRAHALGAPPRWSKIPDYSLDRAGPRFRHYRHMGVDFQEILVLLRKAASNTCLIQIGYSSTETTGSQWFLPRTSPEQSASVPVVGAVALQQRRDLPILA